MKGFKKFFIITFILVLTIGGIFGFSFEKERKFEVDNVLLKLAIKQGDSLNKSLIIRNFDSRTNFRINTGIDLIEIKEGEFDLGPYGVKELELDFNAQTKAPGVYSGKLIILGDDEKLEIPVILEVETKEILFDNSINIPIEYSEVSPGEKAVIENKIFNLEGLGPTNVEVEYLVQNFDGRIIFSEKENILVEHQLLTTKVVSIPKNTKTGDYVFITIVRYGESVGTSTYFFNIVDKKFEFPFTGIEYSNLWLISILFIIILLAILYNNRQRDKFILELMVQRREGIRGETQLYKEKKLEAKKLEPEKRKSELIALKRGMKKNLAAINEAYKSQVRAFRRLKKKEEKWAKKHKVGLSLFILLVILFGLIYYFNLYGLIANTTTKTVSSILPYLIAHLYYIIIGIVALITLIIFIIIGKKIHLIKKLGSFGRVLIERFKGWREEQRKIKRLEEKKQLILAEKIRRERDIKRLELDRKRKRLFEKIGKKILLLSKYLFQSLKKLERALKLRFKGYKKKEPRIEPKLEEKYEPPKSPTVELPKIKLLKLRLSKLLKIKLPQLRLPRLKLPRFKFPKIKAPKIKLLKLRLSKLLKIRALKLRPSKLEIRKVEYPKEELPKIKPLKSTLIERATKPEEILSKELEDRIKKEIGLEYEPVSFGKGEKIDEDSRRKRKDRISRRIFLDILKKKSLREKEKQNN